MRCLTSCRETSNLSPRHFCRWGGLDAHTRKKKNLRSQPAHGMPPARAGLCAHTRKKTIKILAHSIPQDGRPIYQHKKKTASSVHPKNKTLAEAAKNYSKANMKVFWSSLFLLDFLTPFQIFSPELQKHSSHQLLQRKTPTSSIQKSKRTYM